MAKSIRNMVLYCGCGVNPRNSPKDLYIAVIGDLRAHQVGMMVGSLIIFAVAWACIRWIGARTFSEQLKVGAFWMVLMAIFEVSLGLAFGYSLERIFSDYNVIEGRLMIFGMMFMLFAPALAAKARGFSVHADINSLQSRRP